VLAPDAKRLAKNKARREWRHRKRRHIAVAVAALSRGVQKMLITDGAVLAEEVTDKKKLHGVKPADIPVETTDQVRASNQPQVAMLFNPATALVEYWLNPFKAAAASFAVEAIAAPVRDTAELESVIAAQAREPNSGLIVMPDTFTSAYRVEITSLAARYRLPTVYPFRSFAEVGGLLSYGVDLIDNFRRAATYADRILKGAKPSELPVQAPIKFELVINLKTAKALGLDVPWRFQQLADEVIE
jgi:hypothetical protein